VKQPLERLLLSCLDVDVTLANADFLTRLCPLQWRPINFTRDAV